MNLPRVALFADSFLEVNGVAHTCRELTALARRQESPFFLVHGGPETGFFAEGSVTRCQLRRGPVSFAVDLDFRYDLLFYRHRAEVERRLRAFAPDVVHITGPGDAGTLGLVLARALGLPLCASWHTNLHQYAGQRLEGLLPFLPAPVRRFGARAAETGASHAVGCFYRAADVVMAPNPELLTLLAGYGAGPGFLMRRGVDTKLFTPARRRRTDAGIIVGYVGRLTVEKNVRHLVQVAHALRSAGIANARFLVAGDGAERPSLEAELPGAGFRGVLRGEALADAYAEMDIFAFPSATDTFGNVVLEALASGVPAVVTASGGPRFIVQDGKTGLVAGSDRTFAECVVQLAQDRPLARQMGLAARRQALETTWESVWAEMQAAWEATLAMQKRKRG